MTLFGLLLMVLLGVIMGFMAALLWPVLFLVIPFVIILAVPFALWAPIYLFEDISVMESLKKTFRLGFCYVGRYFPDFPYYGFDCRYLAGSDDDALVYRHYCEIHICNE